MKIREEQSKGGIANKLKALTLAGMGAIDGKVTRGKIKVCMKLPAMNSYNLMLYDSASFPSVDPVRSTKKRNES